MDSGLIFPRHRFQARAGTEEGSQGSALDSLLKASRYDLHRNKTCGSPRGETSRTQKVRQAAGFDRVTRGAGGVSWLIRWPRKNLITLITAEPQLSMAA
jgi:hypothetical protein